MTEKRFFGGLGASRKLMLLQGSATSLRDENKINTGERVARGE